MGDVSCEPLCMYVYNTYSLVIMTFIPGVRWINSDVHIYFVYFLRYKLEILRCE
jgi:hypothetical protein